MKKRTKIEVLMMDWTCGYVAGIRYQTDVCAERISWKSIIWKTEKKMKIDGTTSGSCPMARFGISSLEPSGSITREFVC
jgi:hypothetical protein